MRSEEGLTSFNKEKRASLSGEKSAMRFPGLFIFEK